MKKVLKFNYDGKEGFLSVVEIDHKYYALAQKETAKIKEISQTHQLLISYELKQPKYQEVYVNVLFDFLLVETVFNQLKVENNLYFKELSDDLCVLEIPKE